MTAAHAAPLVSIIVPSYNQGRFLRQTLDSIFRQGYQPLEVIVMDGASKDETVPILKEYAARYPELHWVSEPDKGVVEAVNKGLARARGTYAGIQSSDDLYLPGAIAEAVALLEGNPGVGLACADIEILEEDGRAFAPPAGNRPFTLTRFLSRQTVIHQSSAFFRLELARQLGGWDARYYCADTELWLRMAFRTQVIKVDRVWSRWRKHPGQRDKEAARMWEAWQRMMAESADLAGAPLRLRLAASAGRRLVAIDYNPRHSRWFRFAQAWLAVLTYPPAYAAIAPKTVLAPGLGRLRQLIRPQASGG